MRIVRIEWQGSYDFEDALALNDKEQDYGVYQVYGEHVVFGEEALLYIGIARDQTYGQRLRQHDWLEENNIILVGRIAESDWHELLEDVEALEIYWHSPPYNSKNVINYQGQPLKLINEGKRGRLSAGCDSDSIRAYVESVEVSYEIVEQLEHGKRVYYNYCSLAFKGRLRSWSYTGLFREKVFSTDA